MHLVLFCPFSKGLQVPGLRGGVGGDATSRGRMVRAEGGGGGFGDSHLRILAPAVHKGMLRRGPHAGRCEGLGGRGPAPRRPAPVPEGPTPAPGDAGVA